MANYIKLVDLTQQLVNKGLLKFCKQKQTINFQNSHSNIPANFNINDLWVNLDCQREITEKRARMIQNIANDFNANAFGVPQVTKTMCNKMVIPDGQGRSIAAVLAGVSSIPCQLLLKSNISQFDDDWEGEHFLTQGDNVQAIDGWQIHRVALNIKNPSTKGTALVCNRAADIERVLNKLNQSGYGKFGYDGTNSVDFCNSYRYFSNGVIREHLNFNVKKNIAGQRDAPELFESCIIYAKHISDQKVEGQNLEVLNYFICQEANNFSNITGTVYGKTAIDNASKRLRFLLYLESGKRKKTKLTNQELKMFLGTTNCANNEVSEKGYKKLSSEWSKIVNDSSMMQSYQQFV